MYENTSTPTASWNGLPAKDKHFISGRQQLYLFTYDQFVLEVQQF